jgi:phosphoribosylformylglycinamidine cyclo-ligase
VTEGDVILGLASDGVHSNGYSLVRRIVERAGLGWDASAPFAPSPLGRALLTPTRLYVRPVLAAVRAGGVHGLAHITGGGLTENLPRILPHGLCAELDLDAWTLPPVFRWLADEGGLDDGEMLKTFNSGVGMVAVVAADRADAVRALLSGAGETVFRLGAVLPGQGVRYRGRLV